MFGKTGTAEFGNANPPQTHAWFIGYRGNLAFAVIVEGGGVGGRVAAPARRRSSSNAARLDRLEPASSRATARMPSGMSADGSIWPVKMPALNPASASNCTPVTYDERGLLRNSNGHACSSGRALRPHSGFGKFAMKSLPTAFSKCGIIGVSVGPGLRQLMRIPSGASVNDRTAVYALIASFDRP